MAIELEMSIFQFEILITGIRELLYYKQTFKIQFIEMTFRSFSACIYVER